MFAYIHNTDFNLDSQGNVIPTNSTKDFPLPPNIPELRFISDKVSCLCLDVEDNLYSFADAELTLLKENIKQIVIETDPYVLTNDGEMYYYLNDEFKFVHNNISWISSFRYVGSDPVYYGVTIQGEVFTAYNGNYETQHFDDLPSNITLLLSKDIKFVRKNLILTTDNVIIQVGFFEGLYAESIRCPYNVIDLNLADCETIYLLTSTGQLVELIDGIFKEIKSCLFEDMGIIQFISIKDTSGVFLQANRGYIVEYKNVSEVNIDPQVFSNDYVSSTSNLSNVIMVKPANFHAK